MLLNIWEAMPYFFGFFIFMLVLVKLMTGTMDVYYGAKERKEKEKELKSKRYNADYQYLLRNNIKSQEELDALSLDKIMALCHPYKVQAEAERKKKEEERRVAREQAEIENRIWRNPLKNNLGSLTSNNGNCCGVYMIYSNETGEFYIGSSQNMNKRRAQHLSQLRKKTHHAYALQKIYDEYGEEDLEFYILNHIDLEELFKNSIIGLEHYTEKEKKVEILKIEQSYIGRFQPSLNVYKDVFEYRKRGNNRNHY